MGKWKKEILERFADRPDLGFEELYENYFKEEDLPYEKVRKCLELFETEFEVSSGLLRPKDKLNKLFNTVSTYNPFLWVIYQGKTEDTQSEMIYQLNKRLREYDTLDDWNKIETIGDFVRAWCGQKPK